MHIKLQTLPQSSWLYLKGLPHRICRIFALSISLILSWCWKKEWADISRETSMHSVVEKSNKTDEERNMEIAISIIDKYVQKERVKCPEYTAQQKIFINNILQLLWSFQWEMLMHQALEIYNTQKWNNNPIPFPFDPNWCKTAQDFLSESKKYLTTLSVYLTANGLSRGIYEYDMTDRLLQFAGKPINKIVISQEDTPFEWRVIPDCGVILLNLWALTNNVFINTYLWISPEAMIRWVIANEIWNCEFYTVYDTSKISEADAHRLSEAYSTMQTLKSYESFSDLRGGALIVIEFINSHYSALLWFDELTWVDYNITYECVLKAHKELLPLYALEYPEVAAIFEANSNTMKVEAEWIIKKILENPERYKTLGIKLLETYEQILKKICREKWALLKI